MLDSIKPAVFADPADLTLEEILGAIAAHPRPAAGVRYDGRAIRPGYHVTEVKAGPVCGARLRCEP